MLMEKLIAASDIYLPKTNFEQWAVNACDQFTAKKSYWKRVAQQVGDAPSTLRFIIPEAFLNESAHYSIEAIRENMTETLQRNDMIKLNRGGVFVKRQISSGIRYGILAAIDLEHFSFDFREDATVIASEAIIPNRLSVRIEMREQLPLEFSHTMLFFEDEGDRIVKELASAPLEQLYSFDLMEAGGHIEGYFLTGTHLNHLDEIIPSPIFVADGNHSLAAAKLYWDKIKSQLSEKQYCTHPARFHLVEMVNIYSESVKLYPIHRLISQIDEKHFCAYFTKQMPYCKRMENLIIPHSDNVFAIIERTDSLLEQYVHRYGGRIEYVYDEIELNRQSTSHSIGIKLKFLKKEEMLSHLKHGKLLPKKAFSIGKVIDKRYYLEGRDLID